MGDSWNTGDSQDTGDSRRHHLTERAGLGVPSMPRSPPRPPHSPLAVNGASRRAGLRLRAGGPSGRGRDGAGSHPFPQPWGGGGGNVSSLVGAAEVPARVIAPSRLGETFKIIQYNRPCGTAAVTHSH